MERSNRRVGTGKRLFGAVALAAVLLGGGRVASATTIASGLLWSENASMMVCSVLNVGSTPAKINSSTINDGSGGKAFLAWDGCFHKTLAPGENCTMQALVQEGAGVIDASVAKGHLRGACQLVGNGNVVIASIDMR